MHGPGHVTRKQRIPLQALRGRERKRSRFETREERTLEDVDARRRLEDRKMPVILHAHHGESQNFPGQRLLLSDW